MKQLVDRGLHGVRLVIADAHKGLAAAGRRWLPEAQQRCAVPLIRHVLTQTPQRLRARLARALAPLFDAPSLTEANRRLAALVRRWRPQLPEAMAVLEAGFIAATQFYTFPKPPWPRIRSTNTLERLHGEVPRRVGAVGLPNAVAPRPEHRQSGAVTAAKHPSRGLGPSRRPARGLEGVLGATRMPAAQGAR